MYNAEEYIEDCLDSIVNQKYSGFEIEIIAVDDGSPDNSATIVQNYSNNDNRIKLIRQKNSGPGGARNTGMDHAKGEYVVFVDADDILAPNALQIIANKIQDVHPEAIQLCGAEITDNGPQKLFSLRNWEDRHHTGMEILHNQDFHVVVMYTVYLREFIENHKLRFLPYIYHEDNEFSPKVFYFLKDVVCMDNVLYLKRVNYDSITRVVNPKKNYDLVKVSRSLQDFASKIPDKNIRRFFMRLSSNAFKMAMTNETRLMDKETRKKFNAHLKENSDLLKSFFNSDRFISKIEGTLLSLMSGNMIFVNNTIFHNPFLRKFSK